MGLKNPQDLATAFKKISKEKKVIEISFSHYYNIVLLKDYKTCERCRREEAGKLERLLEMD